MSDEGYAFILTVQVTKYHSLRKSGLFVQSSWVMTIDWPKRAKFRNNFLLHILNQELLDGNGYSDEAASLYANVVMVASLIIGTILTVLTTEVLNRQNASQIKDQNNNQIGNKDLKEDD